MKVQVTREFLAVKPGEIHPTLIRAGEIVEGRLAEIAIEQKKGTPLVGVDISQIADNLGDVVSGNVRLPEAPAAATDSPPPVAPVAPPQSTTRARLKKNYAGPDETGVEAKFAKGAIVSGAFADTLIASGFATAI